MNKAEKIQKEMREKYGSPEKVEAEVIKMSQDLQTELETNPKYSLNVDPENTYNMSEEQKNFVKLYVQYRDMNIVATMLNIEFKDAVDIFKSYSVQQEIRRIYRSLTLRQFQGKTLTIGQIGGWLSSLITDDFVPEADRLKTMDKVRVAQILIGLNDAKRFAFDNPETVVVKDFEEEVKELTTDQIKHLIMLTTSDNKDTAKDELVAKIKTLREVLPEEAMYLKTLPIKDLLAEIDKLTQKKEEANDGNKGQ